MLFAGKIAREGRANTPPEFQCQERLRIRNAFAGDLALSRYSVAAIANIARRLAEMGAECARESRQIAESVFERDVADISPAEAHIRENAMHLVQPPIKHIARKSLPFAFKQALHLARR